jgi:hypothetical protein
LRTEYKPQNFHDSSLSKIQKHKNAFILAHGYQASWANMEKLKVLLRRVFPRAKFLSLKSYTNSMDLGFEELGQ